jgi:hypothetical protein
MESKIHVSGYTIVFNRDDVDDGYIHSKNTVAAAQWIYQRVMEQAPGVESDLRKLIREYPSDPAFYNYLTTYYYLRGNNKKAYESNRKALELFPDYLYARVNLAAEYIETGETEKVEAVLGRLLDIGSLYPNRKAFHIGEVIAFVQTVIRYLIAIKDFSLAKNRIEMFEKLGIELNTELINADPWYDNLKFAMIREGDPGCGLPLPVLKNKVLYELYCHTFRIPQKILQQILSLPEDELHADLEHIFSNSWKQYDAWDCIPGNDTRITEHPVHALILMAHLGNQKFLSPMLEMLKQDDEVHELWFGDFLTEEYWKMIYSVGQDRLPQLMEILLQPDAPFYTKTIISEAVHSIAVYHPERRQEILDWYRELFVKLREMDMHEKDEFGESPVAFYLADLMDLQAIELKEEMAAMHRDFLEKKDPTIGTVEEMLKDMKSPHKHKRIDPAVRVETYYPYLLKNWEYYSSEQDLKDQERIHYYGEED